MSRRVITGRPKVKPVAKAEKKQIKKQTKDKES